MMSWLTSHISLLGRAGLLCGEVFASLPQELRRYRLGLVHLAEVGFASQVVVMVTGAFTGAVFAAQAFDKFSEIGLASATGPVVAIAMCRELGPVLAALMVAGRVGAAMAAELGTMRVTEQVDSLRALGVNPVGYLVVPRFLAALVAMPILVGESMACGILASDVLATKLLGVPEVWYRTQLWAHLGPGDVMVGLCKGLVFGGLIALISCQQGLEAEDGAVGVGKATTRAVVYASMAIMVSNFFLTLFLNRLFPMVEVGL
jgi:phospholipid/cholesterol/gamma-HCH transport system permease protein